MSRSSHGIRRWFAGKGMGKVADAGCRHNRIVLQSMLVMLTALLVIWAGRAVASVTPSAQAADGVAFEKYWDDEGYEDRRPASVTFHLFREDAPDTELASVTLTQADAVNGESDHWHGVFAGFPVTDDGGTPINYIVTEDTPDNYIASYDYGYDGYRFRFTDDSYVATTYQFRFSFYGKTGGHWIEDQDLLYRSNPEKVADSTVVDGVVASTTEYKLDPDYWYEVGAMSPDGTVSSSSQAAAMAVHGEYLDQKYVIDCVGDALPKSMRDYPVGYRAIWRYRLNLGRHTPTLLISHDPTSYGRTAVYSQNGFEIAEVVPVRAPGRPIEITDTINLKEMRITKRWDDAGHESHRPQQVTVDVYQDGAAEPYATRTVGPSAATSADTWEVLFDDLPRYKSDYTEHEYMAVERPVEGYATEYDSTYYDSVDLTFSTDTNAGFNSFASGDFSETMWQNNHAGPGFSSGTYRAEDGTTRSRGVVAGLTVTLFGKEFIGKYAKASSSDEAEPVRIGITSAKRVHREVDATRTYNTSDYKNFLLGKSGDSYPMTELAVSSESTIVPSSADDSDWWSRIGDALVHYKWDDSVPFSGDDVIINRTLYEDIDFKKVWDDVGYEAERPESATFDLYDGNGTKLKTVTLSADDTDASDTHVWRGSFGEWLSVDADGSARPYVIREREVPGYQTLYDSENPRANLMRVTFSADTDRELFATSSNFYCVSDWFGHATTNAISATSQTTCMFTKPMLQPDGTYTVTVPGSRWWLHSGTACEDVRIARVERVSGLRPMLESESSRNYTVEYSLSSATASDAEWVARCDHLPFDWERTEATSGIEYFLYEQTEPFAYDNVIRNRPYRHIQISKKLPNESWASGAKLRVYRIADDGRETPLSEPVTTGTAPVSFGIGTGPGTYIVRETEAPQRLAYAEDVKFEIDDLYRMYVIGTDGARTRNASSSPVQYPSQTMVDAPTVVTFRKLYADGSNPTPPAILTFYDSEDNVIIGSYGGTEQRFTGLFDADKTYRIHEKSSPAGYSIAKDVTFTVNHYAEEQVVTMTNEKTRAEISKVDMVTGEEIKGAKLRLTDASGTLIEEWTSDGSPHMIAEDVLVTGESYTLHEESAPDGYLVAEDVTFVAGQEGSPDRVTMRDMPTQVRIRKVAQAGGECLPGARLQVRDADGHAVAEWETDGQPHVVYGLVAGGRYVLHEESAPTGHAMAEDIGFAVGTDGTVTEIEMVDIPVPGEEAPQSAGDRPDGDGDTPGDGGSPDDETVTPAGDGTTGSPASVPQGQAGRPVRQGELSDLVQTGDAATWGAVAAMATVSGIATVAGVWRWRSRGE